MEKEQTQNLNMRRKIFHTNSDGTYSRNHGHREEAQTKKEAPSDDKKDVSNEELIKQLSETVESAIRITSNLEKIQEKILNEKNRTIPNNNINKIQDNLFNAVSTANISEIESVMKQGGDINKLNNAGDTALILATKLGKISVLRKLLKYNPTMENLNMCLLHAKANNNRDATLFITQRINFIKPHKSLIRTKYAPQMATILEV